MKLLNYKYFLIITFWLSVSNISLHSQCNMEFYKQKISNGECTFCGDTLFFYKYDITDTLKSFARVYLTYSKKNGASYYGYHILSKVEIVNIDVRQKTNDKKISFSDIANQCICDTLSKYLDLYYRSSNRMLTALELTSLDKYHYYKGNIKLGVNAPIIYIIPNKKKVSKTK